MKSKVALLGLVAFLFSAAGVAQEIENDDMYFNSKDRAKLKALKASEPTYSASIKTDRKERQNVVDEEVNPTDSYSARNVNPEYQARSNAQSAQVDNEDYFVSNYRYNNANNFNNWNNNFGNWYGNPWIANNYYNPYINSWHSPYYGSAYDSWGNPWRNPYYQSGWSSSFSYHWGSRWDYGWGMNFGYGNPYYNSWAWSPYAGYSPWGSYYGWGSNYGWGGYPSVIIVESGNRHGPVYGKRNSRSSNLNNDGVRTGRTYRPAGNSPDNSGGRPVLGGRSATESTNRQPEYYNRSWRTQQNNNTANPSSSPSRSSWESNTRNNSWRESNSGGSYSPSRSSGYDAGRSSGGASNSGSRGSSGSSSGSRSSGRGN